MRHRCGKVPRTTHQKLRSVVAFSNTAPTSACRVATVVTRIAENCASMRSKLSGVSLFNSPRAARAAFAVSSMWHARPGLQAPGDGDGDIPSSGDRAPREGVDTAERAGDAGAWCPGGDPGGEVAAGWAGVDAASFFLLLFFAFRFLGSRRAAGLPCITAESSRATRHETTCGSGPHCQQCGTLSCPAAVLAYAWVSARAHDPSRQW